MENSSINTITSTNGNITNAGTITSLTYTAAPTIKAIQTKANTDSITNTGTITTFTNNGGNLTNTGSIQTYTQEKWKHNAKWRHYTNSYSKRRKALLIKVER